MDDSERTIYKYLTSRGLGTVVYEPDGKVPPDFLVDGRIAVEVRRLNQNETIASGHRGLEQVSEPLHRAVQKALAKAGPPTDGTSWFVFYSFSRPLPRWKEFEKLLAIALQEARGRPHLQDTDIRVTEKFQLHFLRAGKTHPHLFVLGGSGDHDSGGFVVSEMARNLQIRMAKKTSKVSRVRGRYSEWWLAFEDRISYGVLDESDRTLLRQLVQADSGWSKIILVNPLNPLSGYEL